jgi:hydroxymethylpyrimidine pyrophosphatase-like HAD family hydrolase
MRYRALASDYDGTLANHGRLASATRAALLRLRAAQRKIILVTGREMHDLERVCPELRLFDRIVAENGATLFDPATREERVLAPAAPERFVTALHERGVTALYRGRVVVATTDDHAAAVGKAMRDVGLDWRIILNKGALMMLPPQVDKPFGLRAALEDLQIAPAQTIAVGDGENDVAMLEYCGLGIAVAGALACVKQVAAWTTPSDHGDGAVELVDRWLLDEFADLP